MSRPVPLLASFLAGAIVAVSSIALCGGSLATVPAMKMDSHTGAYEARREHWGRVAYGQALRRQLQLHRRRCRGEIGDTLITVEHPPTISLGRNAPMSDVLWDEARRHEAGLELLRSDRAGRATYHGPGQAVVYPLVDIAACGLGVRQWVQLLEDAIAASLRGYGIETERRCGHPGLWTAGAKIASLGLRIVRGVSYHGVSVNVSLDVSVFDCIVTCGVASEQATNIYAHSAERPSVEDVSCVLADNIEESLGRRSRAGGLGN